MQKNLSQQDRYVRGIWRNSLSNLVAGAIVFLIITAIRLLSGCETMMPGEPNNYKEKSLSNKTDSMNKKNKILTKQEMNDWDKDSTIYQSTTQTEEKRFFSLE